MAFWALGGRSLQEQSSDIKDWTLIPVNCKPILIKALTVKAKVLHFIHMWGILMNILFIKYFISCGFSKISKFCFQGIYLQGQSQK